MAGNLVWVGNLHGASQPWRVASEDHLDAEGNPRQYVLKNFCHGEVERRYVEYVCTQIAAKLDIGAPRTEILEVTPAFLGALRDAGVEAKGLLRAEPGPHMGVRWFDAAVPLPYHLGPIHHLKSRSQIGGILGADTFLQNDDRHAGNLLLIPSLNKRAHKRLLLPIDWGLCFLGRGAEPDVLRAMQDAERMYGGTTLLRHIRSANDFAPFLEKLAALIERPAELRSVTHWVPEQWRVPDRWKNAVESHLLARGRITLRALAGFQGSPEAFSDWQYTHMIQGTS